MNNRIKKKLYSRCGIFHYRDFNPCNPRVSIAIVDRSDYVTSMKTVEGKSVSFEICHVDKPSKNLTTYSPSDLDLMSKQDLEHVLNDNKSQEEDDECKNTKETQDD